MTGAERLRHRFWRMIARLFGIKIVERGAGYFVMRFPAWFPESAIASTVRNVERDAAIMGVPLRAKIGHQLVRFERAEFQAHYLGRRT